jgi:hypothetical protein
MIAVNEMRARTLGAWARLASAFDGFMDDAFDASDIGASPLATSSIAVL